LVSRDSGTVGHLRKPVTQLLDIAKGLAYLHTRESGAIYHGNLKGVCPLSFVAFLLSDRP